jgi:uncharacterized C2H2 Zn-finger protein
MIDRQHGDIFFECDSCSEILTTNQADFNSAWNMAKREGWTASKIGSEWVHACPRCKIKKG